MSSSIRKRDKIGKILMSVWIVVTCPFGINLFGFFARIELKHACNSKGELLKIRTLTNRAQGKRTRGILRKAFLRFY